MKKGLLYLLVLVLLVSSVSAEYYPYDYPQYTQPTYWGYGSSFGIGNFDFNSLYDRYHLFIDAIIFGFIFFGLGSIVWAGKQGYTPLYIGLGLFMTASLLLFESRTTLRLLDLAGPWAVTVLVVLLSMLIYKLIHDHLVEQPLIAGGVAVLSGLWLLSQLSTYLTGAGFVSDWLITITTSGIKDLVFFAAIIAVLFGVVMSLKGKRP